MKRSICIASYNGERFIAPQINSILDQISQEDEVIVVDDSSIDGTLDVVEAINDERIKIVRNPVNKGHVRTFETAIAHATGDIIYLSDQDDIWPKGRVAAIESQIRDYETFLLIGNFQEFYDDEVNDPGVKILPFEQPGLLSSLKNLTAILFGGRYFFGSCMAFSASLKNRALPFPGFVEAHDRWITVVAAFSLSVRYSKTAVTLRRVHGDNLTPRKRRSLRKVIYTRVLNLAQFMIALRRKFL